MSLGSLLDATADVRHQQALIALLDHDDWRVRQNALTCLLRIDHLPVQGLLRSALERRLLEEPREDLRRIIASELVHRRGIVPRGRVDRQLLAWTDRLASADRSGREQALDGLRSTVSPDPACIVGMRRDRKGCAFCRSQWERGEQPPVVAVDVRLHSRLHRCEDCGACREQHERYAGVIDESEARKRYPGAFTRS